MEVGIINTITLHLTSYVIQDTNATEVQPRKPDQEPRITNILYSGSPFGFGTPSSTHLPYVAHGSHEGINTAACGADVLLSARILLPLRASRYIQSYSRQTPLSGVLCCKFEWNSFTHFSTITTQMANMDNRVTSVIQTHQ